MRLHLEVVAILPCKAHQSSEEKDHMPKPRWLGPGQGFAAVPLCTCMCIVIDSCRVKSGSMCMFVCFFLMWVWHALFSFWQLYHLVTKLFTHCYGTAVDQRCQEQAEIGKHLQEGGETAVAQHTCICILLYSPEEVGTWQFVGITKSIWISHTYM